jgi:hypothetical protein
MHVVLARARRCAIAPRDGPAIDCDRFLHVVLAPALRLRDRSA